MFYINDLGKFSSCQTYLLDLFSYVFSRSKTKVAFPWLMYPQILHEWKYIHRKLDKTSDADILLLCTSNVTVLPNGWVLLFYPSIIPKHSVSIIYTNNNDISYTIILQLMTFSSFLQWKLCMFALNSDCRNELAGHSKHFQVFLQTSVR